MRRSAPAKLLRVGLSAAVGMDEAGRAPPAGLAFPRRQNWPHYPVLELDLSSVPETGAPSLPCMGHVPAFTEINPMNLWNDVYFCGNTYMA